MDKLTSSPTYPVSIYASRTENKTKQKQSNRLNTNPEAVMLA